MFGKHAEQNHGHSFLCLPLRNGVMIYCLWLLIESVLAISTGVIEDPRVAVGGYEPATRTAVIVLGWVGLLVSLCGLTGLQDNHQAWVVGFAIFSCIRCQYLQDAGHVFTSITHGTYNQALTSVALAGHCKSTVEWYRMFAIFDFFFTVYGSYITYVWVRIMYSSPTYHIALDETAPLNVYTGFQNIKYPEAEFDYAPEKPAYNQSYPNHPNAFLDPIKPAAGYDGGRFGGGFRAGP